jgi:prepilin-type N-terminal cleavage/methylation domain-containing protein
MISNIKKKKACPTESFRRGFTIIEILVVIGIIAILSVIIFPSIYKIRAKNRDSEKVSDIATIQLGLSLYFGQNGVYPDKLEDISPKYIPDDARFSPNDDPYIYVPLKRGVSNKCIYYHLGVLLELPNPQINNSDIFSSKKGDIDNNYVYCGGYGTNPGEDGVDPTISSSEDGYMYHVRPN